MSILDLNMAVSVSGNLPVAVEDVIGNKLAEKQALEKCETKALGVSHNNIQGKNKRFCYYYFQLLE